MATTTTAPTLTLSGGTRLTKALVLGQPFVIGSARDAQFRIPHPSVAPRHAQVIWDGRRTSVENVSGTLELKVRDAVIRQATLRDGDTLRIGDFLFNFASPKSTVGFTGAPTVVFRGQTVEEITLQDGITFGSSEDADVLLDDDTLLPVHAIMQQDDQGFTIVDKGGSGLLANGRFFERHRLYMGDRLDFGEEHTFVFSGWALRRIPGDAACALTAQRLEVVSRQGKCLLRDAGFEAGAREFVGIIGPSGAGKTTLLRALCGLNPLSGGEIFLNKTPSSRLGDVTSYFGYVPQKEIVHLDLTGRQALQYAAALRLPARAPWLEILKLISQLAERLGLSAHLDVPARNLSGGQLKRLSVAVEMLSQPPMLLLDEPTSGLDPEAETLLMRQLRDLTTTGCTVVCATHLMENTYLMDSVEIVSAAAQKGEPGTTVFRGRPSAASEFFGTRELAEIYPRLRQQVPSEWRKTYEEKFHLPAAAPKPPPEPVNPPPRPRETRRPAIPVLLKRQWDILRADRKNLWLLFAQPVVIGLLLNIAAAGSESQTATKLFLACIATFWMACGQAAPEVVRERAIFERERFSGLRVRSYLLAKSAWLWALSLVQALVLFLTLKLGGDLQGAFLWQLVALGCTSFAATGLGLLISAWARNVLQAVLLVPILTIPQILFSGYVFSLKDWEQHATPRIISRFFPGFASQRIVDTSLLWGKPISNFDDMDKAGLVTSFENLSAALRSMSVWLNPATQTRVILNEPAMYSETRGQPPRVKEVDWDPENPPSFRLGAVYAWSAPAWKAVIMLMIWGMGGFLASFIFLKQQRE